MHQSVEIHTACVSRTCSFHLNPPHGGDMYLTMMADLDGCVRPPCAGKTPKRPPRELHGIFHAMKRAGYTIAAATGGTYRAARETENHLSMRFDYLSPSFCTKMLRRGNSHGPTQFHLVPKEERDAVTALHPRLDEICKRHRGIPDDRSEGCYTMFPPCERTFDVAVSEVSQIIADTTGVRFMAHRYDRGVVAVADSAGKQLAVKWLRDLDHEIIIAAGDTASDIPLLEAAAFPIVTITQKGSSPHPGLVTIAKRKGGYIATRPYGFGLIDGLRAAREAGKISF